MKAYILPLSDPQADLLTVGGKGMSLAKLTNAGFPVPDGFHVTTEAYRQFVKINDLQAGIDTALKTIDRSKPVTLESASRTINRLFAEAPIPGDLANAIVNAYAALPGSNPAVAVRSSATAEDLPGASFAGQQETYLNITGADQVLDATKRCWASLWTARAIGYRLRQGIQSDGAALAVVVQLLVNAEAAGILFTANPLDGKRDQAVINAAWGLGEAVVSGAVTPDTITISKSEGRLLQRETAEKLVMTVRTATGVQEQPVPDALRKVPVLSDEQAVGLAKLGARIEALYAMPMDIEWTLADGVFAILQARPVTALPEAPIVWVPPDPKGVFMRASVIDLMPDPLSPLFLTLGIPSFKRQMKPMTKRVVGAEADLGENYLTSVNSYAYMGTRFPLRGWLWMLFRLLPAYPRLLSGLVPLWREEIHPHYQAFANELKSRAPGEMSSGELWRTSQEIVDAAMYYICALMFATMGASAGAELLLTRVYEKLARQEGDPPASTLMMGWDNIPVQAEKSLYDLAMWCQERPALAEYVLRTGSAQLAAQMQAGSVPPAEIGDEDWLAFCQRFASHLDRFGYIIFQLDFAEDLPLDRPEPMLENIKMYLRGEGVNPHTRQQASQQRRIQTSEAVLARLKGLRRWAFSKALKVGQTMAQVREDALAEIGLGYPVLRAMLRELGRRFTENGVIQQADDIFWLEKEEIASLVAGNTADLHDQVLERKQYWDRCKQETPPPMIPMKNRVMGFKADVFIPQTEQSQTGNVLKGVPTSAGKVTAPACILHGPEDFDRMKPGDVLVAATTTPAWTPLFTMASAVVTDIGGPLSHGSIVAREYGIPAVMGTGIATRRIQNGQMVTVDGSGGTVSME
jgi:phosphohistidine swiveling domain-containing protein